MYTFAFMLFDDDYIDGVSLSEYYSSFNLTQRRNYKQENDTCAQTFALTTPGYVFKQYWPRYQKHKHNTNDCYNTSRV